MNPNSFENRHIGLNNEDVETMLSCIGLDSIDQLIKQTIPNSILKKEELNIKSAINENEYLSSLKKTAQLNKNYDNFIGQGYYGTFTPSVIKRNILCNPGWYTAYTPYQALASSIPDNSVTKVWKFNKVYRVISHPKNY